MSVGTNSNALFYSIYEGRICRQFKQPTDRSVSRVNKMGKTVHEEYDDYIDGVITNIQFRDHQEYGKQVSITIEDDGKNQILQFQLSGGYGNGFLKALPNVDINKKVKLVPKLTIENDKKKSTLFINQDGKAIKWAYTKENTNGLPPLKKIKVKGKDTWDDSDACEFLEEMVKNKILPKIKKAVIAGDDDDEKNGYPSDWDKSDDEKLPV